MPTSDLVLSATALVLATGVAVAASAAGPAPPLAGDAPAAVRAAFQHRIEARLARMLANARAGRPTPRTDAEPAYFAVSEAGELTTAPDDGAGLPVVAREAALATSVEDLHAHLYGDTAVVTYRLKVSLRFNGEATTKPFRVTEVFHRTGRAWKPVAYHETAVPGRPVFRAKIDPRLLDDYAGDYRLLPSVTYSFVRKGDRLFWAPGEDTELVPESDSSFAADKASDYRVIFLRNEAGKVTGARIRELSGVEYTALRVEGASH